MKEEKPGALAPYRVLDLTDEKGIYCGKLLADLGADVIQIEPPGGNPARRRGPFYQNSPHPEKSLFWFAFAVNKRSITLNIETLQGRDIFMELVKKADVVVESFPPGRVDELGLGYSVLSRMNRPLILTSISPFGQTGPHRDYKASDIVVWAMGGIMYISGDQKRPPVRISFPQAYLHAGASAASGTVIALYHRLRTGEGQCVDAPAQQAVVWSMTNARETWDLNRMLLLRSGNLRTRMGAKGLIRTRNTWPCRDGYVQYLLLGGSVGARTIRKLIEWMDSEGVGDDHLRNMKWEDYDLMQSSQEEIDAIESPLARFFQTHTMAELYQGAVEKRIMLYPLSDSKAIAENPQLADRDFWVRVDHPELGASIDYPGPFMKASRTPCRIRRRAPLIGEHNGEVYGELGLNRKEIERLEGAGVI